MSYQFTIMTTTDKFEAAKEKLAAEGIDTSKTQGTIPPQSGVGLDYNITPGAQEGTIAIEITIAKKPFIVSNSYVQSQVEDKVNALLG